MYMATRRGSADRTVVARVSHAPIRIREVFQLRI
jgi:hypothetical protein